jgi:hypothetical protein
MVAILAGPLFSVAGAAIGHKSPAWRLVPGDRRPDSDCCKARKIRSTEIDRRNAKRVLIRTSYPRLDAAPCGIDVNPGTLAHIEFEFMVLNANLMAAPAAALIIE